MIGVCDDRPRAGGAATTHWLVSVTDRPTLTGPIQYPEPTATEYVQALGDGTWLTADDEAIFRWALA